jgi:hypothetical protein
MSATGLKQQMEDAYKEAHRHTDDPAEYNRWIMRYERLKSQYIEACEDEG